MKKELPELSDEIINKMIDESETAKPKHPYESVLEEGDNAGFIEENLAEGEGATGKKDVDNEKKKKMGKGGAAGSGSKHAPPDPSKKTPSDEPASSSASSSASSRKPVQITGASTPAWAKTMMPPVKGCWIKLDDVRHFRWQCGYPRETIPRSTSQAYSQDGVTYESSLHHCLTFLWDLYEIEEKMLAHTTSRSDKIVGC